MMDSLPNTSRAPDSSNMLLAGALAAGVFPDATSSEQSLMYHNALQAAMKSAGYQGTSSGVSDTSRSGYPSSSYSTNAAAFNNLALSLSGYDLSRLARTDPSSLLYPSVSSTRGGSSHDAKRNSSQKSSSSKSNRSPSRSNHHSSSLASQIGDKGSSSSSHIGGTSTGGSFSSSSAIGSSSGMLVPTAVVSSRTSTASHSSRSTSVTNSTPKSSSSVGSNPAATTASSTANSSYNSYHTSVPSGNFDLSALQNFQRDIYNNPSFFNIADLYTSLTNSNYKKLYSPSLDPGTLSDVAALQSFMSQQASAFNSSVDQTYKVSPPKPKPSGTVTTKDTHEAPNPTPSSATVPLPSLSSGLSPAGSLPDKQKPSASSTVNQKSSEKIHHFSNKALIAEALVSYAREMHTQDSTKDIILTCEDKVCVPIHSELMMAYCSSYVEMFEISKSCGQCTIVLTDTKSKDVSDLVNALYTGKLPSDCSLTGVNYVAQLLGLKKFVSLLQRSLKDDINQSFLRRHNTENLTKTGYGTQSPVTLPGVDTLSKSYKIQENCTSQDNSSRNQAQIENAEKRGTKRKSDASSTKFSEQSQYRAKEPKLENFSAFVSDASPLNLSKSSSSSTTTSASDNNTLPTVSNVPSTIEPTSDPNSLLNQLLLSKCQTDISALRNMITPSSGLLQQYDESQLALLAQIYNPPSRSKNSSKTASNKTSKPASNSTPTAAASSSASDNTDDLEKLESLNAWAQKNPHQYLATLFGSGDASINANYLSSILQSSLSNINAYGFPTTSGASIQDAELDPYRDSTGALNLSADARDDSKTKKDATKMDLSEAVSASSIQNTWASSVAASSAPAFTAPSYPSSDAASTISVTGSYAPYSSFDYKTTNGLMARSSLNSSLGLTDLSKLFQNSTSKQVKTKGVDGEPNGVGALASEGLVSSEDGMDDIIEVLADEDGSLLASYAGGQRRLLYHAGHGRRRKGCGTCENCLRSDDCGGCRYCADKAKFGGQNKLKQVCERKRCLHDVPQGVVQKSKTRCLTCKPCLLTEDCDECEKCIINKGLPPTAKKLMCESRLCEYLEMEDLRARNFTEEPSPYSTESVLTEAQAQAAVAMAAAAAVASVGGASNCPSPDDYAYFHGDKKARKMLKKKTKDGKGSSPKARTKYQCNACWGCITTSPCQFCVYCRDMPKHGGTGKYRQKCVKQLCILHPRLQSNKINVIDPEAPLQCELEIALEPFKDNFDAAAVTKGAMVNFVRLHHRQEGGDRERQITKMLDTLARKKQIIPELAGGNDMDFKEERGETPDNPEYSSEPCRASGSTTASTPEPSDGGLAGYPSRHLPDLRPILGSAAPNSAAAAGVAAYNAALSSAFASTSDYASVMQLQQLMLQHQQGSSLSVPATSTNTSSVVNTKIDTVTIADSVRSEADVDVERVENVAENDVIVATDLSSQKKNTEAEVPSTMDAEVIPVSSSSSVTAAPSEPVMNANEHKYLNEEQPIALDSAAPTTSLPQEEDDKESVVEVLDTPAGDAKEEPMEVAEDDDKCFKQTSIRRGRGNRGKRSSETRGRTSRSRSQRRSPSPSPVGAVRTRAQSRELPPRRARAKTNSYAVDPFDHLDNSESEDVMEEIALASDHPMIEENGALVKGNSEEDEDTRSAEIQAAVQGVLDHELAEDRITEDSKRSDPQLPQTDDVVADETESGRWDIKTSLAPLSESSGNDANGNKTDASSAQAAKLYRLDPQQEVVQPHLADPAASAEFGTGTVAPPPVPKLKLRLSNGPSRAVEKVDSFDSNGINS